jgi:GAF domain-containing protein
MKRPTRNAGKPAKKPRLKGAVGRRASPARSTNTGDPRAQIDALKRELAEAREQQAATNEVLKIISNSTGDLEVVFLAMLEHATRICEAKFGTLFRYDGERAYRVASLGTPTAMVQFQNKRGPFRPGENSPAFGNIFRTKTVNQIADLRDDSPESPPVKYGGARTTVLVPMLRNTEIIGVFVIYRQEIRTFTDKQIELVQNFAAQAVIVIENTRLLNELRQRTDDLTESLEQQTATSEVLKVISSSPGELAPVFQAMLESATRICEAKSANLALCEGDAFRRIAQYGAPPALDEDQRRNPIIHPTPGHTLARLARTKQAVHIADLLADPEAAPHTSKLAGARTFLVVPMLKDDELVGGIGIYRQEVRPFTAKQIELVSNFAAQAVIAIENTRLLNELRQRTDDLTESLEQQTAASEVLKVISSSLGELAPVFSAMLANATQICEASYGMLFGIDHGAVRAMAMLGVPTSFAEFWDRGPQRPSEQTAIGQVIRTKQTVHILDVRTHPAYVTGEAVIVAAARLGGFRTFLVVPMIKDGDVIGLFSIYRQEVRAFTPKQIELVTNFAAQAVIAIENTRLLNELRQRTNDLSEALEQQKATSEVLGVISSSPGDLPPVFNTLLANATRICDARFGIMLMREGEAFREVAQYNQPPEYAKTRPLNSVWRAPPGGTMERILQTMQPDHIEDIATRLPQARANKEATALVELIELAGARTILTVPMIKDNQLVGAIGIYRQEVRLFSDKQISLLQNFAAQAVIAIENTRLLNELRQRTNDLAESLEQQTATSEVLQVISSSPNDLQPVFEAIVNNAARLCEAQFASLYRAEDNMMRHVASYGGVTLGPGQARPITVGTMGGRVISTGETIHVLDTLPVAATQFPESKSRIEREGIRTALGVPLRRGAGTHEAEDVIGAVTVYRTEVRPFTDKQIELVQNFATQAVIAVENTRLLSELRESLQQQTATADVLKVISTSPGDLKPVFQALLVNAVKLCEAQFGGMFQFDGRQFRHVAMLNMPIAVLDSLDNRGPFIPASGNALDVVWKSKKVLHTIDDAASFAPITPTKLGGARTHIAVPMLKDGEFTGAIVIFRQEVRPFTDQQIELVTSFAAQAVIAIENARLLSELRERTDDLSESLEQQTATSEVLKVISSSAGDLEAVFQAILENATRICGAEFGTLFRIDDSGVRVASTFRWPPAFAEFAKSIPHQLGPLNPLSRMRATKETLHLVDYRADVAYLDRDPLAVAGIEIGGIRTLLDVPMFKDGEIVGAIGIFRQEVQPFSGKQIELVQNFAAQAVIAIENARLLNELRQSLQQQTATADVLKVISRSTFDLQAVLDALTESAARLCEADQANIARPGPDDLFFVAATYGLSPKHAADQKNLRFKPESGSLIGRVLLKRAPEQIEDAATDPEYTLALARKIGGFRTMLGVPLMREDVPIGVFGLTRRTVRPFTQRQVQLLTTFADQAAIAIENVRLFDEIQDKSRQLAEASQHKSQFLANMSHELRTPLNAILGYTELIIDGIYGETPEKAQAVLKRVESNGKHLLGLINDVLDLSKIEAGQLKLSLADYSVKDVVYNVFSAVEPLAMKKNLKFKVDVSPDMPTGHGDEHRLTQVLLNLVGNAIKFTDAGEVAIRANLANGSFSVAVHDTGPGIDPANQTKLFEEFQQADNSITKAKGGTGLGLAISRRIIELHGGRLWVESSLGSGSTFTFTLPIVVEQQARPS